MSLRSYRTLIAVGLLGAFGLAACSDDDDPVGPGANAPAAPANVTVSTDGDVATVSWSAAQGAESYRVELSAEGEETLEETVAAGETSATFSGLSYDVAYAAQVFAINAHGETGSQVVAFTPRSNVVVVSDDILENTTWTSDKIYLLRGPIFVGRDVGADGAAADGIAVTLTIEPGTTILGDADEAASVRGSYLVISRGSKIIADANANRPEAEKWSRPNPEDVIVFTSSKPRGQRARGDWGGIVINGRAPTNAGPEAEGEGDSGLYGGPDEEDSSGILRGVRVEFAGDRVTATDELNGIAFQGVGAGTTVDYVQVHYNVDDGTEPFGGTVSQTHMVMTGIGDDSFDGTDGYRGFMQFLIVQQRSDAADNGLELSGNGDNESASPKSTSVVANATVVGAGVALGDGEIAGLGGGSDIGINLREGSNYRIYNTIVTGFGDSGLCIEGAQAIANANARLAGETDPELTLAVEGTILWNNVVEGDVAANFRDACGDGFDNEAFFLAPGFNNMVADPNLPASAFSIGSLESPPSFVPSAMPTGYSAVDVSVLNGDAGLVMPTDGRTLQATGYAGAVEPGTALEDAWYYGWTVWAADGSDSRPNHEGK